MAEKPDVLSVIVAAEFVVVAGILVVLVPLDAVVWVIPMFLICLGALYAYLS